jgi:hypothetical protein
MRLKYSVVIAAVVSMSLSGCQPDVLSRGQLERRLEHQGYWRYIGTTNGSHFVECSTGMGKRRYFRISEVDLPIPRTIPVSSDRFEWEPLFCTSGVLRVAVSADRVPHYAELTNGNAVIRTEYFATGDKKAVKHYLLGPGGVRMAHGKWEEWKESGEPKKDVCYRLGMRVECRP